MPSEYHAKLGDRAGVSEWKELATAGDIKRLLAWAVHSLRNGTLERQDALAFSQLAAVMLKAVETSDLERDLMAVKARLDNHGEIVVQDGTVAH